MKKFTISMLSALFCGLVVLSACGGAKKGNQDAEAQTAVAKSDDKSPSAYRMPALSVNDFCGDLSDTRADYGYLMPEKGLFLKMNVFGTGSYGINVYTYVMDGDKIVCTPGHFVNIATRSGDKVEITMRKRSKNNSPSFTFVPILNCDYAAYVTTEQVAGKYFYLCGDGEARYKFEDIFEDERYVEFKNFIENYGK